MKSIRKKFVMNLDRLRSMSVFLLCVIETWIGNMFWKILKIFSEEKLKVIHSLWITLYG